MLKSVALAILSLFLIATPAAAADPHPEPVILRAAVNADTAKVWEAFTTQEGVQTFFSRYALVEPRIGGAYEIYFLPDNPPGLRGGEGVRILAMEQPSRFFISWNAPLAFPRYRNQKTVVEIELEPVGDSHTLVTLTHSGWGRGSGWAQVRNYFNSAWKLILGRLQYRFDHGPVNWAAVPDGATYFKPAP